MWLLRILFLGYNLIRKIPWRRAWQPTPVLSCLENSMTEEPGRLQSMGLQRVTWLNNWHNTLVIYPFPPGNSYYFFICLMLCLQTSAWRQAIGSCAYRWLNYQVRGPQERRQTGMWAAPHLQLSSSWLLPACRGVKPFYLSAIFVFLGLRRVAPFAPFFGTALVSIVKSWKVWFRVTW